MVLSFLTKRTVALAKRIQTEGKRYKLLIKGSRENTEPQKTLLWDNFSDKIAASGTKFEKKLCNFIQNL